MALHTGYTVQTQVALCAQLHCKSMRKRTIAEDEKNDLKEEKIYIIENLASFAYYEASHKVKKHHKVSWLISVNGEMTPTTINPAPPAERAHMKGGLF